MNQWANDWVQVYSSTDRNFMTSGMEDSGTLTALQRMARIDLVDAQRVLVLRTISNFTVQPPGKSVTWSTTADYPDDGRPALEAAFVIGNTVVEAILTNWDLESKGRAKAAVLPVPVCACPNTSFFSNINGIVFS